MPIIALLLALALASPAFAGDCAGTAPNDICESGRAAPAGPSGASPSLKGDRARIAPHSRKVHSAISQMVKSIDTRRASSSRASLRGLSNRLVRVNDAGEIQVYVTLGDYTPEHVAALESLGMRVELTLPDRWLVQGWLPSAAVDTVAALDFVQSVKPPSYGQRSSAGAADTEGDALTGAATARTAFNVSGAGVKVGVISDGVDDMSKSVTTGDLPAGVQVVMPGSGNEGTALLEIVHDIAPGASLAFAGPETSAEMVTAVQALSGVGARVIVDDLAFFGEPKFEDGPIANIVRAFAQNGNIYVSSAGNQAQAHYRAVYNRLTGQKFPSSDYPGVHNYAPGSVDIGNTLVVPSGCSLTAILQWNNRFGASGDDFDLVIARTSDLAILGASAEFQEGTGDPIEAAFYFNASPNDQSVFISVAEFKLVSPPGSLILDYFALVDCSSDAGLQYNTAAESLSGNHNLVEAMPIAAAAASAPTVADPYSSQGPGTIVFPTLEVRNVPVLTSVDCVTTETGVLGFFDLPFCGTSASAPHVAGIAALLIEKAPTLSSDQLRSVLTSTAIDLGPPGYDFTYGFGFADAAGALNLVSSAPHVQVAVALSRHTVAPGDLLQVSLLASNVGIATTEDVYFGAIAPAALGASLGCPAGDALVLFADNFSRLVTLCYTTASPQAFAPLYPARAIPAALPPTALANFSLPWPSGVAGGAYTFVLFATPPGALADGVLGASDLTSLSLDTLEASP